MCLITFAWKYTPANRLVLLANRDEFYERPTASLYWWDGNKIAAGRDLKEGGTWLGINRNGKWAAVTNFRAPGKILSNRISRGKLVLDYLENDLTPQQYLSEISIDPMAYNGYNLLVGTMDELYYYSNIRQEILLLEPGIYGLSNHLLDTPWPKVQKVKNELKAFLTSFTVPDEAAAFKLMNDTNQAPDASLPDTGVGLTLERMLSPICIQSPAYGTRSTSFLSIPYDNKVRLSEKDHLTGNQQHIQFTIN